MVKRHSYSSVDRHLLSETNFLYIVRIIRLLTVLEVGSISRGIGYLDEASQGGRVTV